MSNSASTSLIQRAAERLREGDRTSLVEKAAKRLAEASAAAAPAPAPAPAELPRVNGGQAGQTTPEPARPAAPANGAATATPAAIEPLPQREPAEPSAPSRYEDRQRRFATIETVRLQMAGFVTPNSERNRTVEEFRILKRPLLLRAFATGADRVHHGNMIMVTSSSPREGKTFTAVNLAMSVASERDLNVLLIDADMHASQRGMSATGVLGIQEQEGLLDVLAEPRLDLGDVLIRTNIPNLTVLPSGKPKHNPTELFASNRMGAVVDELVARYPDRVIIFDTPPVLAASEASVLAMHVGQIVFVVEAENTSQKTVESALSYLSACPNVCLMLNKARADGGADRFGSYSYY